MLKYILLILLIIVIYLLISNDFLSTKLKITEHQKQTDALNLSGSSTIKRNLSLSNESTKNSTNPISVQRTCCNFNYELTSNQYSLTKLSRICEMIPIEIKCMQKCIEIKKDKRIEFNLEVNDKIEEWIEQRLSFQEVICFKIKKELNFHSKQASLDAQSIDFQVNKDQFFDNQLNDLNRLSKEQVFNLIKNLSHNLGLNQLNSFENEFIFNDQKSNKFIVNRRGVEILKQIRIISKLLAEENEDRLKKAKERGLNLDQINQRLSNSNQFNQHFNQLSSSSNQFNQHISQSSSPEPTKKQYQQHPQLNIKPNQFQNNFNNPYNYLQNQFVNTNRRKDAKSADDIQTKQNDEIQTKQNDEIQTKQNDDFQAKQTEEIQTESTDKIQTKQIGEIQTKQSDEIQTESTVEIQTKQIGEIQTESTGEIQTESTGEIQTESTVTAPNQLNSKRVELSNSNKSIDGLQCVKMRLNASAIDYLRKNNPNITILNIDESNKLNKTNKMIHSKLKTRGLLSMLGLGSDEIEAGKSNDLIVTRLFPLFSPSSHKNITSLAGEVLKNHSIPCQQDFKPNLSDLLILNLRLKHSTNYFRDNQTSGLDDLCNELFKIGDKLKDQLENCMQSPSMNLMIKHMFNDTEMAFKFCLDFEFNNKLVDTTDQIVQSGSDKINHLELDEKEMNQLNVSEVDYELIECLNWNKLRSCQSTFIPWFELISIEEFQQLIDNKSMKFNDLNLFKRTVSYSSTSNQISSVNCKDVLLFENCVKEDLDDFINLDFRTGKLIESDRKNLTCQFGAKRINKIALAVGLTNRITNLVNEQMSNYCPELKTILNLVASADPNERDDYHANVIKYYSKKYTEIVNDEECSESTSVLKEYCIHLHINYLKPAYVQFYKNLELQTYFKAFVSNQHILPRICCAQRQLARCLNSAANFKCLKNQNRTSKLITDIGRIDYCSEFDTNTSMSQCRYILSLKMQSNLNSSAFSINSSFSLLFIIFLVLFIF